MADVINLNRVRKAKKRQEKTHQAAQNRVIHGRTKAEKRALRLERERADRAWAGHRRDEDSSENAQSDVSQDSEPEPGPEPET